MDIKTMTTLAKEGAGKFGIGLCDNYANFIDEPRNYLLLEHELQEMEEFIGHKLEMKPNTYALSRACAIQWYKYGLNVFDITDSLLAGLLLTTPSDEPGFPRFPFPAFVIRIPPKFVPMKERGPYVVEKRESWLTQISVNHFKEIQWGAGEAMSLNISTGNPDNRSDDVTETILLRGYANTAEFLKEDETRWASLEARNPNPSYREADNIVMRAAIRIVSNLCSWLESIGGLAGRKPSNAPLKRVENAEKSRISQWIVGREIKLEPELLKSAKEHILGLDTRRFPAGWHLTARFPIRGHMRHQACGKDWSERKVIWIKPHFHGPQGGDVMARIYKAGDGKH
jgi:hypothetical protein